MHFRVATTDDAPRLHDIIHAAFRFTDAHIDWVGSPELAKTFTIDISTITGRITSPDGVFLIASATPDGPAIGCVNVFRKTPGYGRVALLAVDPTLQRGGMGLKILQYGEEYLTRELGVGKIGLNALVTRKELLKWYEKQGYVRTGEVTKLPRERVGSEVPEELVLIELDKTVA
ncbi:hypothetical protein F53441_10152 [Fusarium austroafricanum]|uniref:N-acetyltransferase domain-containing protein n=1 Tax=Fusarium austroafricanum TaxID=2364996 RepID=A0A8H4NVP5_9HYPO|nr:hypothetical protein F53441_10152 [Fusarium austroafricanum]